MRRRSISRRTEAVGRNAAIMMTIKRLNEVMPIVSAMPVCSMTDPIRTKGRQRGYQIRNGKPISRAMVNRSPAMRTRCHSGIDPASRVRSFVYSSKRTGVNSWFAIVCQIDSPFHHAAPWSLLIPELM